MCGIAGYILLGAAPESGRLTAMADSIRHRGPDGEGYFAAVTSTDVAVGLAHRRLAIIDLAGGDQPMTHPATGAVLIYNGEIYNFETLRLELEALGHCFRTRSDTEVLLNAYVEWGPDCVRRLRGMFAFAIWDPSRQRLVLGRDQFGKKPLYLHQADSRLLFGSEIKALLAYGDVGARLDLASVADYLMFRYVPGPNTLFTGIRKLMPGSYAVWEAGRLTETTYYTPPYGDEPPARRIAGDGGVAEFGALLDEAVRIRMVSDVPYGAFLSGGLDSSALVALMSRHTAAPVNTFAVGFKEAGYSELSYAQLVATQFRTRHTELMVSAENLIDYLPTLIYHSDGPVAEASNIPIYLLSLEAAKTVKMVLTGEGSDELLGGYPRHTAERFVNLYQTLMPQALHARLIEPLVAALPYRYWRLRPVAAALGERDFTRRMTAWLGGAMTLGATRLLSPPAPPRALDPRPFHPSMHRSALERILYFEQSSWLPDNLLERGDRLTMAASIEARMPFMDTELTRLMANLQDLARIRGFTQKYLLRRIMRDTLPKVILNRPKIGFRVPIGAWFRGPMRGYVRDQIAAPGTFAYEYCDRAAVDRVLGEHDSGRRNNEKLIWMLLNLQLFQQHFRLAG